MDELIHRLRSGGVSMDKRCQIEVVFSPPRPDLANVPSPRRDPGGVVFRLRREDGAVCVSGSVGTLDPFKALERAQHVALRGGFEKWRVWNAGGAYVKLNPQLY